MGKAIFCAVLLVGGGLVYSISRTSQSARAAAADLHAAPSQTEDDAAAAIRQFGKPDADQVKYGDDHRPVTRLLIYKRQRVALLLFANSLVGAPQWKMLAMEDMGRHTALTAD